MNRLFRITGLGAILLTAGIAAGEPAALPDAPTAQQDTNTNPQTPASAPSLVSTPSAASMGQLGIGGKFDFYVKTEFSPINLVIPAGIALYHMANPPDAYPRDWKDGGGAFGRNFGSSLGSSFSANTARFITGAIVREDPRYFPSENRAFGARVGHALKFVVIDKGDSGHDRIALSNFAGVLAGGFIGNAYLPPGYRDGAHAEQRSLVALAFFAGEYQAAEFRPEIRSALRKMHVPFIK